MPRTGPGKYRPLAAYLAAQPAGVDAVTLSFPEIEAIIAGPLPPAAYRSSWWSSARTMQSRAWQASGWRAARRELRALAPAVTFARLPPR